jgi:hypothetical protein
MNRGEFGKLVASLRKETEDEDGRLWSQGRLAIEANMALGKDVFTQRVIGSIEEGRRNIGPDVILPIADALQLTSYEREQFFLAASGVDSKDIARRDNAPDAVVSELVNRLERIHLPASIMDSYCHVLAVNSVLLHTMQFESSGLGLGTQADLPFGHNWIRFVFSPDGASHMAGLMGEHWDQYALSVMTTFRCLTFLHRATPYFQALLRELRKSRLFKLYWRQASLVNEDWCHANNIEMHLKSPKWGQLVFLSSASRATTSAGDLYLFVDTPASADTAIVVSQIITDNGPVKAFRIYNAWPNRHIAAEVPSLISA